MFIFGWGRSSKTHQISPSQAFVLGFTYFHIFWLFRVSFSLKYSLATLTESGWATRALSPAEAMSSGATTTLTLHWWWRFGLLIALATIVVISLLSSLG